MNENTEAASKPHYICQTYTAKSDAHAQQGALQLGKLFQYTTPSAAEERAEREARGEGCVGADAYMVVEDINSGEVSAPTFLARHGSVPEADAF